MKHRHIAASIEGVVQLIAASYLRHGYYWYVTGQVPLHKNPMSVDEKLIEKYQINVSDWERTRRRKTGIANAQYVRLDRWFIIMVTEGHHPLKQATDKGGEGNQLKDVRRYPIRIGGYSISYRRRGVIDGNATAHKWHAHVRIDGKTYNQLKSHFDYLAVHRSPENLTYELSKIRFARYAPIRRQLLNILRSVNEGRKQRGFEPLPYSVLSLRRKPVKVYVDAIDVAPAKAD